MCVCVCVCMYACVRACVRVRQSEREGLVVFGRHCVRFILKKRQQKQQQQQQERQQSIRPVIRNDVMIAMKCGTVTAWINKEAAATFAFKSVTTLKGVFLSAGCGWRLWSQQRGFLKQSGCFCSPWHPDSLKSLVIHHVRDPKLTKFRLSFVKPVFSKRKQQKQTLFYSMSNKAAKQ